MSAMSFPDWRKHVVFSTNGPQPITLIETAKAKVLLAGLEAGQKIPVHPDALAMYHFLEGNGWMIVDGERIAVQAGATIITPEGASRGMEAETRLAFLATRIAGAESE